MVGSGVGGWRGRGEDVVESVGLGSRGHALGVNVFII